MSRHFSFLCDHVEESDAKVIKEISQILTIIANKIFLCLSLICVSHERKNDM